MAIEASDIGVWEYNLNTQSLYWDKQMYRIYNVDPGDFSGAYDAWAQGLHPDDRKEAENDVAESVKEDKPFNSEFRVVWPDGTVRNIKAMANIIYDTNGQQEKMLGVNWDITEMKTQQELLEKARIQAEDANHSKTIFLSNMSHEIRTPLNGILGYLELILDSELSEEQRNQLKIVQKSGTSLLSIINDILDYSKIESGHFELHCKPTCLYEILTDVKNMFLTSAKKQEVTLNIEINVEKIDSFNIDSLRLNQVVTNLIGNSIKFTHQGSIEFCVNYNQDKQSLDFVLKDTGIGISEKGLSKLFQPFERDLGSRDIEGTGLGLSIVKKLIELMHGEISCKSTLGIGTEFKFSIPAQKVWRREEKPSNTKVIDSSNLDFLKVLVVDDNEINLSLAKSMLAKLGISAQTANSGKLAIEKIKSSQFDVVFMDVKMPEMDGFQTTRLIRKLNLVQPKIVALTAQAFEEDKRDAMDAGMDSFISKPFRKRDLENTLKTLYSNRKAS